MIAFMLSWKKSFRLEIVCLLSSFTKQRQGIGCMGFPWGIASQKPLQQRCRVQYNQLLFYIELLSKNGTFLPNNITKHIDEDIWELRPGNNRVLYFYSDNDAFVRLHHFRKKTMKTPLREIQRAKAERDDYIARKEANSKWETGKTINAMWNL